MEGSKCIEIKVPNDGALKLEPHIEVPEAWEFYLIRHKRLYFRRKGQKLSFTLTEQIPKFKYGQRMMLQIDKK